MKNRFMSFVSFMFVFCLSGLVFSQTNTAKTIPGLVAIDLSDSVSDLDVNALETSYGITLEPSSILSEDTRIYEAKMDPSMVQTFINTIKRDRRVDRVEEVGLVWATGWVPEFPNDPRFSEQWSFQTVGGQNAWGYATGRGVVVAVVDTGIACEDVDGFHKVSDLAETKCIKGYNFVSDNDNASDDQGHGTHVAGTIAQSTNNALGVAGLAFDCALMPVKVLSANGSGTTIGVADGVRWAADHGADVINMSLGGGPSSEIMHEAVRYAQSKGVIVVVAAGNNGKYVEYPGAYDESFTVSATDQNDQIAYFSSRGPQVNIAAPGVDILQQTICDAGRNGCEQYAAYKGTSMATPHVAGIAALLMSAGVNDVQKVKSILSDTANLPEGNQKGSDLYGAGVINAGKALAKTVWTQIAWRVGLMLLFFLVISRIAMARKQKLLTNAGLFVGAMLMTTGVAFFLPLFYAYPHIGYFLVTKPITEWDMLLGLSVHSCLPVATFAVPLILSALLFSMKQARPFIAGTAMGSAAYLITANIFVSFCFGPTVLLVWTVVNVCVCLWLAYLNLVEDILE